MSTSKSLVASPSSGLEPTSTPVGFADFDQPEDHDDPDWDDADLDPWAIDAWELSALDEDEEPQPEHGDFWQEPDDTEN